MAEKSADETKTKGKPGYMCEVCRCRIPKAEAEKTSYWHCGRKMTEMEVIYMSDPSPSRPLIQPLRTLRSRRTLARPGLTAAAASRGTA